MAKPNGRGGWDLTNEDVAEVMAASFGGPSAAERLAEGLADDPDCTCTACLSARGTVPGMEEWLHQQLTDDERRAEAVRRDATAIHRGGDTVMAEQHMGRVRWVLRDIEAKRRILVAHAEHATVPNFCRTCGSTAGPCETKRLLALPYSDRPGYRTEWAP